MTHERNINVLAWSWSEIPDIATAHARGYLTIWPPNTQRKCTAEIKQNKIEHVLAYREQVPRSGRVLESFLGYSDKLVFINKCYWPCFSSMFIFEAWPIQCSLQNRGLKSHFCIPRRFWSSVADNIVGISQVPRSLEEKHRMMYVFDQFPPAMLISSLRFLVLKSLQNDGKQACKQPR